MGNVKMAGSMLSVMIDLRPVTLNTTGGGARVYKCSQCADARFGPELLDFVVHILMRHNDCWTFRCEVCVDIFTSEAFAQHFGQHLLDWSSNAEEDQMADAIFKTPSDEDFDEKPRETRGNSQPPVTANAQRNSRKLRRKSRLKLIEEPSLAEYQTLKRPISYRSWRRHVTDVKTEIMDESVAEKNREKYSEEDRSNELHAECAFCANRFTSRRALRSHVIKHLKDVACSVCGRICESVSARKTHFAAHKLFTCAHCDKGFIKESLLKRHMVNYTRGKYHCDECGAGFCWKSMLKKHRRTHLAERPYRCEHCGKNFSLSSNFKRHCMIHTGEKPFLCSYCGKGFTQKSSLKYHLYTHIGDDRVYADANRQTLDHLASAKKYACSCCGKEFFTRNCLKVHMRVHTKEKPYQCAFCSQAFAQKGALDTHTRIHSGVKPFKCPFCEKCYTQSVGLTHHVRTHTGEQPYKCHICGRAFSAQSNLVRHQVVHTGQKKFSCEHCKKEFSQLWTLSDHINVHTGARPYGCTQCSSRFANRSTLIRHTAVHDRKKTIK